MTSILITRVHSLIEVLNHDGPFVLLVPGPVWWLGLLHCRGSHLVLESVELLLQLVQSALLLHFGLVPPLDAPHGDRPVGLLLGRVGPDVLVLEVMRVANMVQARI